MLLSVLIAIGVNVCVCGLLYLFVVVCRRFRCLLWVGVVRCCCLLLLFVVACCRCLLSLFGVRVCCSSLLLIMSRC